MMVLREFGRTGASAQADLGRQQADGAAAVLRRDAFMRTIAVKRDRQAIARRERCRRQASPPARPAQTNQVVGSGICWGSNGGTYVQTSPASPATTSCPEPAYISIQKP